MDIDESNMTTTTGMNNYGISGLALRCLEQATVNMVGNGMGWDGYWHGKSHAGELAMTKITI